MGGHVHARLPSLPTEEAGERAGEPRNKHDGAFIYWATSIISRYGPKLYLLEPCIRYKRKMGNIVTYEKYNLISSLVKNKHRSIPSVYLDGGRERAG